MKAFLLSFGINLLFNLGGLIPCAIAVALHFIFRISLWWAFAAAVIYLIIIFLRTLLLYSLNKAGNMPEKQRPNKNPYSKKSYEPINRDKE